MLDIAFTNSTLDALQEEFNIKRNKIKEYTTEFNKKLFSFFEDFMQGCNIFQREFSGKRVNKFYKIYYPQSTFLGFEESFLVYYKSKKILTLTKDLIKTTAKYNMKYIENIKEVIEIIKVLKEEKLKKQIYFLDANLALIEDLDGALTAMKEERK